jgi:hypothetical protein
MLRGIFVSWRCGAAVVIDVVSQHRILLRPLLWVRRLLVLRRHSGHLG